MKWFVGVVLLLLAALLLESGLLAYAAYVLLGLLLVSRVLARTWARNLAVERTCKRSSGPSGEEVAGGLAAEVGDQVVVTLKLHNRGWLPIPWVLLEDLLPRQALGPRFPRLKVKGKRLHVIMLRGGGEQTLRYTLECVARGYFTIGPTVLETGDLFGLHRRWRVLTRPRYLLVYPRVVPLTGYELMSRRPIGDVRLMHRLFEDPTRMAGIRSYEPGDPLNRVHWRATARTGTLQTRICEPSTLAGATVVVDFHKAGYPPRGEPFRTELAVSAAVALVAAVAEMGQQVGLLTNASDAAARLRTIPWPDEASSRQTARAATEEDVHETAAPLRVDTRRGVEQLQRAREVLARAEPTDVLTFADLLATASSRLPRDATVVAILPAVPTATAIALGSLRRQGYALTVVLIMVPEGEQEQALGRPLAEGVRDVRHLQDEAGLPELCRRQVAGSSPYALTFS
jgi:uncharacterized protein (DUF58 family)